MLGVVRDITEFKRSEMLLADSRERLSIALSAARIGTWRWNILEDKFTCDENLNKLLGLPFVETTLSSSDFFNRIHADDRPVVKNAVDKALKDKSEYGVECRMLLSDGSIRWFMNTGRVFSSIDSSVSMAGACIDVTEHKCQEEELRNKEQMLIQQSKLASMGEMIGNIAHQWRQPLNILKALLIDLSDAYEFNELDKNYLDRSLLTANEQMSFMSKTIDDFRDFFKPKKEKERFDIKIAVGEALSLFNAQLRSLNISYTLRCAAHNEVFSDISEITECDDMFISTYKSEFKQVVMNLISNSKDAILGRIERLGAQNDIKGEIRFDFRNSAGRIIVDVKDNGGGIADDIINRVFEPYFTTKFQKQGTGIGLYMSKLIIEHNMKGRLSVSNNGSGAVFRIDLPQVL
ncbi:PAS/PAC sensor signal transduction histidine kinase [Candidatus Magnetoovum chiemensis]|nr:PAS/PAC sensor signal transduction histidine kinase [Candidatus Magnetoovum chiemensis]